MTEQRRHSKAAQLRTDFDRAFAQAHASEAPAHLDLLLIRVGGHPYALPLSQVVALHAGRALTPVPSARPDLLGLVGLRGVVTPVYDLSALLGYATRDAVRFLLQVDAASPFAVAFEHFERHARVPATAVAALPGDAGASETLGSLPLPEGQVTVLNLRTLFLRSVHGQRAGAPKHSQERQ